MRLLRILNRIEEWTLVWILLGLSLLTFVQVICRYIFNFSFNWAEELSRYVCVLITFLGASLGVKYGVHFSMNFLFERVSHDRFRNLLQLFVNLLSAALFLLVAWFGWLQAMKLRQFGVMSSSLEIPKYWAYLPIPLFSVTIALRFLHLAIQYLGRFLRDEPFRMLRSDES